jgi:hypothetical protein
VRERKKERKRDSQTGWLADREIDKDKERARPIA